MEKGEIIIMDCPRCEGNGHEPDMFDFLDEKPNSPQMRHIVDLIIDTEPRTSEGRRFTRIPCTLCGGTKRVRMKVVNSI